MRFLYALVALLIPGWLAAQPQISLDDFASGFVRPVDIAHANDNRLFIVEQRGIIWIVDSLGNKSAEPFLNIDPRVRSIGNEQGLLGLAFHPNYHQNGYFYVQYTRDPDGDTHVSRFTRDSLDAAKADPNSEVVLIYADQPFSNHNAGCLKFGPDGYLYVSIGDGGSAGDPQNNGQKKNTFLGKILRIDVDSPVNNYGIPPDNPFLADPDYRPEIWSTGWRNVWRFSFDRLTGDMWLADVGQNAREEISFEPAQSGGRNYGWRCYEGFNTYNTTGCQPASGYTEPVFDYPNPTLGCSVTGGFVYRGSQYPDLYGWYIFTDYCSGRWWVTRPNEFSEFETFEIDNLANNQFSTLGEDIHGELYVARLSEGKIQKIREICSAFQLDAQIANATCIGAPNGSISLSPINGTGNPTYDWSNGQSGPNADNLNPGVYSVTATNGNGCVREATFEVPADSAIATPDIVILNGNTEICPGDTLLLEVAEAPAGFGYQWLLDGIPVAGADGRTFTTSLPGQISHQYTSPFCLSAPSTLVSLFLTEAQTPDIGLLLGQTILCPGDSAVLGTSPSPAGYTLQWFDNGVAIPNASGQTLSVQTPGLYSVSLNGYCGEFSSAELAVDQEVVAGPVLGQNGDTLLVLPGWTDYQWYLNGEIIPGAMSNFYIATQSGFYECAVLSANGCAYRIGADIEISATRLPDEVTHFLLTPNPTRTHTLLQMTLTKPEKIRLSMSDAKHREYFSQTLEGREINKEIDLSRLPAGVYYLRVDLRNGSFVRPIVKQ